MKTYTTKSNARRAAKNAGEVLDRVAFKETAEGKWMWYRDEELKVEQESSLDKELKETCGHVHCPHCNIHLSNGVLNNKEWYNENLDIIKRGGPDAAVAKQLVSDYQKAGEMGTYECLGCGETFGELVSFDAPVKQAAVEPKKSIPKKHHSEIESPCRVVWEIAESMPGARRKDVLEACVKAGIAYNTARTQYQRYTTALKSSK